MSGALVVNYHAISPSWTAALSVTPERLEPQVRVLARRGYRGIGLHEAIHAPRTGRTVAVTFDDGFRSVLELGLPILKSFGFTATVFLVTDHLDDQTPLAWAGTEQWLTSPHAEELASLSWPQARQLAEAGWEIGSHTCSHPDLTKLSDTRLIEELERSKARCEQELDRPCRSFAYPFGAHDERVVRAVRAAGYTTACTVPDALGSDDPLTCPRVGVYHSDGLLIFRTKVSPSLRYLRSAPAFLHFLGLARAGRSAYRRLRSSNTWS